MSKYSALELVKALDKHIIGQDSAKKAVSIAVLNRARRLSLPIEAQKDILPSNILLVGPSGVGKTEIARRLAELVKAPFIKVEATKFTEVGYVGQDVEKIIKDLVEVAVRNEQDSAEIEHKVKAEAKALALLKELLPEIKLNAREFKQQFESGEFDEIEVEVEVPSSSASVEIIVPPGLEEMTQQIEQLFKSFNSEKMQTKKVTVPQAFKIFYSYQLDKALSDTDIVSQALEKVQNNGIVFLDEIDKLVAKGASSNSDISRGGVQRDLLPLIEGTTVATKYGSIRTDHILFIASGAFIDAKPTDLASELQGRLPVVVRLSSLTKKDMSRILVEPKSSITHQYKMLLTADDIQLEFDQEAIDEISELAFNLNKEVVDLGARRLSALVERILEPILYDPPRKKTIVIDKSHVDLQTKSLVKKRDDSAWIL